MSYEMLIFRMNKRLILNASTSFAVDFKENKKNCENRIN